MTTPTEIQSHKLSPEAFDEIWNALKHAEQNAVCCCPEDEKEGRVIYHSNCYRKHKQKYSEALARLECSPTV